MPMTLFIPRVFAKMSAKMLMSSLQTDAAFCHDIFAGAFNKYFTKFIWGSQFCIRAHLLVKAMSHAVVTSSHT